MMSVSAPEPEATGAGELLESFGQTMAARAEEGDLSESLEIAREMEKLGRLLQQRRMDQERVEQRLAELADRIDSQMEGLSRTRNPESRQRPSNQENEPPGDSREQSSLGDSPTSEAIEQLTQELIRQGALTDEEARFLEETKEALDSAKPSDFLDGDGESKLGDLMERARQGLESETLASAERTLREARRSLGTPPAGDDGRGGPGNDRGGEGLSEGEKGASGAPD